MLSKCNCLGPLRHSGYTHSRREETSARGLCTSCLSTQDHLQVVIILQWVMIAGQCCGAQRCLTISRRFDSTPLLSPLGAARQFFRLLLKNSSQVDRRIWTVGMCECDVSLHLCSPCDRTVTRSLCFLACCPSACWYVHQLVANSVCLPLRAGQEVCSWFILALT